MKLIAKIIYPIHNETSRLILPYYFLPNLNAYVSSSADA